MKKMYAVMLALLAVIVIYTNDVSAATLFFDNFNAGADPAWSNALGNWSASGGVYNAQSPSNVPPTYSLVTTLPALQNFALDVDIQTLQDGGVWLRTDNTTQNGVLLVTGGYGGSLDGLYWHTIQNGGYSGALNVVSGLGIRLQPSTHLRVEVIGDTYSAYLNGSSSAATVLTTNLYSQGYAGLYDFMGQSFDNFSISDFNQGVVPEPASISLLGLGMLGLILRKTKKA
jgi:hypothetical protein